MQIEHLTAALPRACGGEPVILGAVVLNPAPATAGYDRRPFMRTKGSAAAVRAGLHDVGQVLGRSYGCPSVGGGAAAGQGGSPGVGVLRVSGVEALEAAGAAVGGYRPGGR